MYITSRNFGGKFDISVQSILISFFFRGVVPVPAGTTPIPSSRLRQTQMQSYSGTIGEHISPTTKTQIQTI